MSTDTKHPIKKLNNDNYFKWRFKRNCGKYVDWLEQCVDKLCTMQPQTQGNDAHFTSHGRDDYYSL